MVIQPFDKLRTVPSWQEIERSFWGKEGIIISLEVTPPPLPEAVFRKLKAGQEEKAFWLDSARFHPQTGRYSFMGLEPIETFNEISQLREFLNGNKVIPPAGLPPFTAGLIGYFSYDIPDCEWVFVRTVISWDHQQNRCWITEPFFPDRQGRREYEKICERLRSHAEPGSLKPNEIASVPLASLGVLRNDNLGISDIRFEMDQRTFEQIALRAKEYIACGDIYQVNLSQRISAALEGDPLELYLRLRDINPSPFACYLPMNHVTIAGSSPERLLKVTGNRVETRPIAGTRPRVTQNPTADRQFAQELLLNPKERAEHIMLVDLERNDLGRVCEYGSVRVNEMMTVEEYSHVRHIVSNIEGELREDCDRFDIVRAAFPGGTITGTPKIRAMEIIEELEPVRRALYTGSVGYLSLSGEMDLNIVIRTFVITGGRVFIQVGAGIVADSDPEKEYQETLHKAEALLEVVQSVRRTHELLGTGSV